MGGLFVIKAIAEELTIENFRVNASCLNGVSSFCGSDVLRILAFAGGGI